MPSDAAMKLADKIVEPVESIGKGSSMLLWRGRYYRGYCDERAAEVVRIAAIIDEGLAEVGREQGEALTRVRVYCTHLHRCELVKGIGNNPPRRCTCGLDAALAACRKLKGAK